MSNGIKQQIARSFRMEMIGTGCYRGLSAQYLKREPKLGEKFREFAGHEYMHGTLFETYFRKTYGKDMRGEKLWISVGRLTALMMRLMPLKDKLKKLSTIESQAVAAIEKALAGSGDNGLQKIMKTILPDEKAHAGLYREWFPSVASPL